MQTPYDIVIIGGGTAGMTAAIYGYRTGKKILIIEKTIYGGQIISASEIENYPGMPLKSGYEFAAELKSQLQYLNILQVTDEVVDIRCCSDHQTSLWNVIGKTDNYLTRTVIIASGATHRPLGLPEEERFVGHGLSYCATCDGMFYKDKTVAVIGGGNTAMEEALYLSLLCRKIYLIHRSAQLRGDALLQSRIAEAANIQLLPNTKVLGLHGSRTLDKIELSSTHQEDFVLQIDGIFVAIGQVPQNDAFAQTVDLDREGYIIADENCHTNAPGIFAAGDCRTKQLRQLVTAAADGAAAAVEAGKFLRI